MIRIRQTGPQALIQDRGRFGLAGTGVSPSGVFDRMSAIRANHALGNHDDAAVIEILMGSFEFETTTSAHMLLTGMGAPFSITSASGDVRWGYSNEIVDLEPGDVVFIKMARTGLRGYLSFRGGLAVPKVLGSRATDVMSNLGPAPLQAGDELEIGTDIGEPAWWPALRNIPPLWRTPRVHELAVVLGPRNDWFTEEAQQEFFNQEFEVSSESNRIGIRLNSATPLTRLRTDELASEGMTRGSIQVPPSGNPVIFGPDYPVTGGYPVIGVLTRRSSDHSGQLAPGDAVRFVLANTSGRK